MPDHPDNGWSTAVPRTDRLQLALPDDSADVRLTSSRHYREVAFRDFTVPAERRWTSTVIRRSDGQALTGQGPTAAAAWLAAKALFDAEVVPV